MTTSPVLRLAHSPDPDDAFMWWPLVGVDGAGAVIDTDGFTFETIAEDIERLNQRSADAPYEITALSCAQYARVADRYALTACGASMGDGYGPKLVARSPLTPEDLRGDDIVVAIPGEGTSAFAFASLLIGPGTFRTAVEPFDTIIERVADGTYAAGIVIHEGQLTFGDAGLHLITDLGAWWSASRGLPAPLGVNAIRRDLETTHGAGALERITRVLRASVDHALAERETSVRYALQYARDMSAELADEFIALYVNRWTLAFGETGEEAVRTFLGEIAAAGLGPAPAAIDFITPDGVAR